MITPPQFAWRESAQRERIKRILNAYGIKRFYHLGHARCVKGDASPNALLGYVDAKKQIYLPAYKWVLDNAPKAKAAILELRKILETRDVVLLDYNTSQKIDDPREPLSHAFLIKLFLENKYPTCERESQLFLNI